MQVEFKNTFAVLPSWSNKPFNDNHYTLYIINEDFFGLHVKSQFKTPQEAIEYIGVLLNKYPTESEYFSKVRACNYGKGVCTPNAERAYVQETLKEYGNTYYTDIEKKVIDSRKIPVKPFFKPMKRKFITQVQEVEAVETPTRKRFKASKVI